MCITERILEALREPLGPGGTAATESIELRLSRFASDGLIEEVELTNHSKQYVSFPPNWK
jgi:hypothetical protein